MNDPQLANTLFYTFSTVSQSLAVAVALLASFVAYKLSDIDRLIRGHLESLYKLQPGRSENFFEVYFLWSEYNIPKLLEFFDEDPAEVLEFGDGLDRPVHLSPAKRLYAQRQELLAGMSLCFWWTAGVIIGALLVLSITSLLANGGWYLVGPVLSLGLAAVVWCLYLYRRLLKGAFDGARA